MADTEQTTLLVIRHGETVWNRQNRFQGHGDSPLTEAGRRQARALGNRLKQMPIDTMISSDLGRAVETAAIIADSTGHGLHTDQRLRERNFGILEGLTGEEIRAGHPEVFERLYADDPDYAPPNGESLRQHYLRIISFLEEFIAEHTGTAALVAHGGVLDSLFRYIARMPLDRPRCFVIPNAGLNRLVLGRFYRTRRWVIETWGDVSHLEGIQPHAGLG